MAAGTCRRAISDTRTSQSGFAYHKMHSIRISIYETLGIVAGGIEDDFMFDENDFDDERMALEENLQDPEEIIDKVMQDAELLPPEENPVRILPDPEELPAEEEDGAEPARPYQRAGQQQKNQRK